MENAEFINNVIRVGTVSSVDAGKRTARVIFPHLGGMVSGELFILQHDNAELHTTTTTGHESHSHKGVLDFWLPTVGQTVVCAFVPVADGDGFILGRV